MKKRIVLLLLLILSLFPTSCSLHKDNRLIIDILSIGKADCIVIRQNETVIMIDTGEEENAPEILSYLNANRITEIDCLILSHFDKDHIGSAAIILDKLSVKTVYESTFDSDREEFDRYHSVIAKKNIPVNKIDTSVQIQYGEIEFILSPPKQNHYDKKQDNNASLIASLFYRNTSYLFCGDAMEDRLEEFIEENKVDYHWMKVPYHGNYLTNYNEFLINTKPDVAAICCSDKNPSDDRTLSILKENQIDVYETRYGMIRTVSDGESVTTEYKS